MRRPLPVEEALGLELGPQALMLRRYSETFLLADSAMQALTSSETAQVASMDRVLMWLYKNYPLLSSDYNLGVGESVISRSSPRHQQDDHLSQDGGLWGLSRKGCGKGRQNVHMQDV